jgi:hypothetical protein
MSTPREIERARFKEHVEQILQEHGLIGSVQDLADFIRNPEVVWYGPHECNGCGATIVKSSIKSGGVSLDAPHDHHYPNHQWARHNCPSSSR